MFRRSIISAALFALLFGSAMTAHAAPGPGASLDTQIYDVTLYRSNQGEQYTGQFTFDGDPERPQRLEMGTWQFTLNDAVVDANPGATGAGNWVSLDFFFLDFWLALASTDADTPGSVLVWGIAFGDQVYGKAGLFSDPNLNTGFYRMFGEVPTPEIPDVPLPAVPTAVPTDGTTGDMTGGTQ